MVRERATGQNTMASSRSQFPRLVLCWLGCQSVVNSVSKRDKTESMPFVKPLEVRSHFPTSCCPITMPISWEQLPWDNSKWTFSCSLGEAKVRARVQWGQKPGAPELHPALRYFPSIWKQACHRPTHLLHWQPQLGPNKWEDYIPPARIWAYPRYDSANS